MYLFIIIWGIWAEVRHSRAQALQRPAHISKYIILCSLLAVYLIFAYSSLSDTNHVRYTPFQIPLTFCTTTSPTSNDKSFGFPYLEAFSSYTNQVYLSEEAWGSESVFYNLGSSCNLRFCFRVIIGAHFVSSPFPPLRLLGLPPPRPFPLTWELHWVFTGSALTNHQPISLPECNVSERRGAQPRQFLRIWFTKGEVSRSALVPAFTLSHQLNVCDREFDFIDFKTWPVDFGIE